MTSTSEFLRRDWGPNEALDHRRLNETRRALRHLDRERPPPRQVSNEPFGNASAVVSDIRLDVGYLGEGQVRQIRTARDKKGFPKEGAIDWFGEAFASWPQLDHKLQQFDWYVLDDDISLLPYEPTLETLLVNREWRLQLPRMRTLRVQFDRMSSDVRDLMWCFDEFDVSIPVARSEVLRQSKDSHGETLFDNSQFAEQHRDVIDDAGELVESHLITPMFLPDDWIHIVGPMNTGVKEDVRDRNVYYQAVDRRQWGEEDTA